MFNKEFIFVSYVFAILMGIVVLLEIIRNLVISHKIDKFIKAFDKFSAEKEEFDRNKEKGLVK